MGFIAKEFEPNEKVVKRNLLHCFNFDHLRPEQGIAILINLVPDDVYINAVGNWGNNEGELRILELGVPLLNGDVIGGFINSEKDEPTFWNIFSQEEYDEFLENAMGRFSIFVRQYCWLLQYWNSGKHPEYTPPSYFIEWALSKNFRPEWLDRAIEFGLYTPKQETKPEANLPEKPLATTERTTLLNIIAALCDYSKIKYQERGASAQIARLTEASGAPVSEDAISKALKKIPNAMAI